MFHVLLEFNLLFLLELGLSIVEWTVCRVSLYLLESRPHTWDQGSKYPKVIQYSLLFGTLWTPLGKENVSILTQSLQYCSSENKANVVLISRIGKYKSNYHQVTSQIVPSFVWEDNCQSKLAKSEWCQWTQAAPVAPKSLTAVITVVTVVLLVLHSQFLSMWQNTEHDWHRTSLVRQCVFLCVRSVIRLGHFSSGVRGFSSSSHELLKQRRRAK